MSIYNRPYRPTKSIPQLITELEDDVFGFVAPNPDELTLENIIRKVREMRLENMELRAENRNLKNNV